MTFAPQGSERRHGLATLLPRCSKYLPTWTLPADLDLAVAARQALTARIRRGASPPCTGDGREQLLGPHRFPLAPG